MMTTSCELAMIEVCDGVDNDCNEEVDDNAVDVFDFYVDSDEDGFGDDQHRLKDVRFRKVCPRLRIVMI